LRARSSLGGRYSRRFPIRIEIAATFAFSRSNKSFHGFPPGCILAQPMSLKIGYIALVVRDYDEAIAWFTQTLQFTLVEDTRLSESKRWVLIAPPGDQNQTLLLLAKAATWEQQSRIGNQTGGRVFLFLHTDNFDRDYDAMNSRGVKFIREPSDESYGTVAVFEDLYGNIWDLLQLKARSSFP
jgi:catechol 2,3-dioxygenase-like lactoylglutathione lyase family enzyme